MTAANTIGGLTVAQIAEATTQLVAAGRHNSPTDIPALQSQVASTYAGLKAGIPDPAERCAAFMALCDELVKAMPAYLPSRAVAYDAMANVAQLVGDGELAEHLRLSRQPLKV